jgi:hypothetical protein
MHWRGWTTALVCVFVSLTYALVGHLLGQDVDFDLLNYHFFDPYWLLVNHMQDAAPAWLQTYYNPFIDIPFYFAARSFPAWTVGFGVAIVQSLSFPVLYLIARFFVLRRPLAFLFAGLGMFTSIAITELGTITGDTLTAPLILGGVFCGLRAVSNMETGESVASRQARRTRRPGRAVLGYAGLAGALVGVAAGLKLSGIALAISAVASFIAVSGPLRSRVTLCAASVVGLLGGLIVSYGWWGYEMVTKFGDPIFPYLNEIFHSRYAPLASNADPGALPHGFVQTLFYPFVWNLHPAQVNDIGLRELTGPLLESLLIVLLLKSVAMTVKYRKWHPMFGSDLERYLVAFAVIGYFLWVTEFGYYRYFVPVEMLAFLLIFVTGRSLLGSAVPRLVSTVMMAVVIIALLATEQVGYATRPWWSSRYFSVPVPRTLRTERAAFLMAGTSTSPNAYVIPYFPADDYFARIQETVTSTPSYKRAISSQLDHYNKIYLVWTDPVYGFRTDAGFMRRDAKVWGRYGFTIVPYSCILMVAKVASIRQGVNICTLKKVVPRRD